MEDQEVLPNNKADQVVAKKALQTERAQKARERERAEKVQVSQNVYAC
jgi:hypothetical protein